MSDPIHLANPLQGSDSTHAFSRGNAWPLVGVPRGMTYWTPQTSDGRFMFNRREVKFMGFRATHAPSPWMGDHGHFDVMPVHGPIGLTPAARGSGHDPDAQLSRPHRYATRLLRYDIDAELTATDRCGVLRCVFPSDAPDPAIVFQGGEGEFSSEAAFTIQSTATGTRLLGVARAHHNGVPDNFGCHLVAEVHGADVVGFGTFSPQGISTDSSQISAPRAGAFLRLGGVTGPVTVRIATSYISHDQARLNLRREVGTLPFEAVVSNTAAFWQNWFSRIDPVGGSEDHHRRLYSAMYRVGLFPTKMHEPDEQDRPHHYSPFDGRIHRGVLYTNNGFWGHAPHRLSAAGHDRPGRFR